MDNLETAWPLVPRAKVRLWIHNRDTEQLRKMVLQNQGSRLLGETAPTAGIRQFLLEVPDLMKIIRSVHEAAIEGRIAFFLRENIPPDVLESRDSAGRTILHKIAGLGYEELVRHIISCAPSLVRYTDGDVRQPSHFCGVLPTKDKRRSMLNIFVQNGANLEATDKYGKKPEYYINNPKAISAVGLGELPEGPRPAGIRPTLRKSSSLPPLSTPTKSFMATPERGGFKRSKYGQVRLKPLEMSNIRKEQELLAAPRDNNRLMRSLVLLLCEGRTQTLADIGGESRNYNPEEFLRDVPVYKERVEALQSASSRGKLSRVRGIFESLEAIPVMKDCLDLFATTRNLAKATPLHQAAVNGHVDLVQYLLTISPEALHLTDMDGRTPLHYAALGRSRESCVKIYQILADAGANVTIRDKAGRVAKDYVQFNENVVIDTDNNNVMMSFSTKFAADDHSVNALGSRESNFEEFRKQLEDFPNEPLDYQVRSQAEEQGIENIRGEVGSNEENDREEDEEFTKQSNDDEVLLTEEIEEIYKQRYPLPLYVNVALPVIEEINTPPTDTEDRKPKLFSLSARERQSIESYEEHERAFEEEEENAEETRNLESSIEKDMTKPADKIIKYAEDLDELRYEVNDLKISLANETEEVEKTISGMMENVNDSVRTVKEGLINDTERKHKEILDNLNEGLSDIKETMMNTGPNMKKGISEMSDSMINGNLTAFKASSPVKIQLDKEKYGEIYESTNAIPSWANHTLEKPSEDGRIETDVENVDGQKQDIWKRIDDFWFGKKKKAPTEEVKAEKGKIFSEVFEKNGTPAILDRRRRSLKSILRLEKQHITLDRDENGNTALHFAAEGMSDNMATLLHRLDATTAIAARNNKYMTPRDVAIESGNDSAVSDIDAFVIDLCKRGKTDQLNKLFLEGYDHLTDISDPATSESILTVTEQEGPQKSIRFLRGLVANEGKINLDTTLAFFQEHRNILHKSIRLGQLNKMKELLGSKRRGRIFAIAKDRRGRCSIHIAVLAMHPYKLEMVTYLCQNFSYAVAVQDNLGRTPLHYAYGLFEESEEVVKVLESVGAKNSVLDYRRRTPEQIRELQSEVYELAKEEQSVIET